MGGKRPARTVDRHSFGKKSSPNALASAGTISVHWNEVEIGAEILLRISRQFLKSVEWLLTGGRGARRSRSH